MVETQRIRRLIAIEVMKAFREAGGPRRFEILEEHGHKRGTYDRTLSMSRGGDEHVSVQEMLKLVGLLQNSSVINAAMTMIRNIQTGLFIEDGAIDLRMATLYPNTARFMREKSAESNAAFGSLIIIWFGVNIERSPLARGIPAESVSIVDKKRAFALPEEAISLLKPKPGRDLVKFCLTDIGPPDYRDSLGEQVYMEVERTKYSQIYKCEPFFHHENIKTVSNSNLPDALGLLDDEKLFSNRVKYGSLVPDAHKIPHALTMLYTLVTIDGYVMLMRRSTKVDYYPGTIDLSGGEQLDESDFAGSSNTVFKSWAKRTVIEEWFPSQNLDKQALRKLADLIPVDAYLQAVAYNELDGNYPVMVLIEMGLTLAKFKSLSNIILAQSNYTASFEGEGVRCYALIDSIRKQVIAGLPIEYTEFAPHRDDGGEIGSFSLKREELHPATPLRLHLLISSQKRDAPMTV